MTDLQKQSKRIQAMFSQIARRYDLMNRLMTAGQDGRWRREVIRQAGLKDGSRLLDMGAGTGDLTREAFQQAPGCLAFPADFTLAMMQAGNGRGRLDWSAADALSLPFPENGFDAVVSGFLMRNVSDVRQALREQYRVLKSGGRIVILDTTRPRRNLLTPFIWIHFHLVIPWLGSIISGQRNAYTYLPESTERFLSAEELSDEMINAGFKNTSFRRLMFATIAIHWGDK